MIEVRSPDDRWNEILQKTAEYLNANVMTVAVVDLETKRVHLFSSDREAAILNESNSLEFPDILPGFSVVVGQLFE